MPSRLPVYLGQTVNKVLDAAESVIDEYSLIDMSQPRKRGFPAPEESGGGITLTDRRVIITKVSPKEAIPANMRKLLDQDPKQRPLNSRVYTWYHLYPYERIATVTVSRGLSVSLQIFMHGEVVKPVSIGWLNMGVVDMENLCVFTDINKAVAFQKRIEDMSRQAHNGNSGVKTSQYISVADEISKLAELRRQGLISLEEYEAAKKKVFSSN